MEADGLVTLVANSGAWVSRLSLEECVEIYQLRERLEPLLLRYSIPGLTEESKKRLEELAIEMTLCSDVEQFLRLDREFHSLSYSGASTHMIGEIIQRSWNSTHHYRRLYTNLLDETTTRIMHDEHRMLVNAIQSNDVEEAERLIAGHIRKTRLQLERHPELFEHEDPGANPHT